MWKIETLLNVIIPIENAWEFEKIGAKRTANMDGFFHSNYNAFSISNTVVKGKWVRCELEKIKIELPNLIISRDILSKKEECNLHKREKLFHFFFTYVPTYLQVPLINLVRFRS
jgi:hypothetical protein